MDRSNVINLISETYTQDEIGQFVPIETKRQVYCNVRSITRSEWFEAGRNGLQPAYVFTMFRHDYNNENIVEFEGKRYGIYRSYIVQNEQLEIYAEEKGGLNVGE